MTRITTTKITDTQAMEDNSHRAIERTGPFGARLKQQTTNGHETGNKARLLRVTDRALAGETGTRVCPKKVCPQTLLFDFVPQAHEAGWSSA